MKKYYTNQENTLLYIVFCVLSLVLIACSILIIIEASNKQRNSQTIQNSASVEQTTQSTGKIDLPPQPTPNPIIAKPEVKPVAKPPATDYTLPYNTSGLAPVLLTIPTKLPVVFLGIDDGAVKSKKAEELLKVSGFKATLFLANRFITDNPSYFKTFQQDNQYTIQNHSLTHMLLSGVTYATQKKEICGMADYIEKTYGKRPTLFRPPGGSYDKTTQKAAYDCGMKAIIMWAAKANGGKMDYQQGNKLRPGDIVLMHFRNEFEADFNSFVQAVNNANLRVEALEDWL